jgi:aspartyl-tRNA synthetase
VIVQAPPSEVLRGWVDEVGDDAASFVVRDSVRRTLVSCAHSPDAVRRTVGSLRLEDVVEVEGLPSREQESSLRCDRLTVLNRAERLPFTAKTRANAPAAQRARYRYLEFRDPVVQDRLRKRHGLVHHLSCFLHDRGFISVETPLLSHESNTGAREFAVRSERDPAVGYALPQSAQVYAQLVVLGGVERYYQLCRCFRDENLRADRQPEFTQLQVELAFATRDEVIDLLEEGLRDAFSKIGSPLPGHIPRIPFEECLRMFGTDKPDVRQAPEVELLPFQPVGDGLTSDARLVATALPVHAQTDENWWERVRRAARVRGVELVGFIEPDAGRRRYAPFRIPAAAISKELGLHTSWEPGLAAVWLGRANRIPRLRRLLYRELGVHPAAASLGIAWVVDMPLFEVDDATGRLASANHPFVAPADLDAFLDARTRHELLALRSSSFDLVLNGVEVGSGSVVNHRPDVQARILELLELPRSSVRGGFSFILEAMRFGAPPIGGFGLGIDRTAAIVCGTDKIREVMAFPKTKQGHCPVTHRA